MFTVYVLYSPSSNKTYTGFTSDLTKRIESHNVLATKGFTIKYRPWIVIHTETFDTKSEAIKREKQLKAGKEGLSFVSLYKINLIKTSVVFISA